MRISELVEVAHSNAKAKGFHDEPRDFGTVIALIHSELSEALEADRKLEYEKGNVGQWRREIGEEFADAVIRIGDACGFYGIDLEDCIRAKMIENITRTERHGKRY